MGVAADLIQACLPSDFNLVGEHDITQQSPERVLPQSSLVCLDDTHTRVNQVTETCYCNTQAAVWFGDMGYNNRGCVLSTRARPTCARQHERPDGVLAF